MRQAAARTRKLLVSQRGPLSSLARRNPALVLTFILAHAEARRQLALWVELEATVDGGNAEGGAFENTVVKLHGYEPYWDSKELREIGALARAAHEAKTSKTSSTSSHSMKSSLVHHLTSNSLVLIDDVRRVLRIVLEESMLEIQKAEDVWNALKAATPDEVVAVSTELLVIDVLRKQSRMLRFFESLGLLEEDEVETCLEDIRSRQRGLRGDHLG